ncbi:MAG: stage 0 sporulation protein [bacterium]|nr:stage 0 sporulation protein [bacterium]
MAEGSGQTPRPGTDQGAAPLAVPPLAEPAVDREHLVLLRFKGRRKSYYHNRRGVPLRVGDHCLVEADRGRDLGRVLYIGTGPAEWWAVARRQGVLQKAAPEDLARLEATRAEEDAMRAVCTDRIHHRGLDMNLVTVERQHDGRKVTFYFTAEGRVDFRELVRDLAALYRARIELRQIGVRDEARLQGGLAMCGREYCCSGFLHEFVPVTLKMAKTQQLPLNPAKLSGPCGRLRCCLAYEDAQYRESRQCLPRTGAVVQTPDGPATVRQVDLLRGLVTVEGHEPGRLAEWPADRLGRGATAAPDARGATADPRCPEGGL